MDKLAIFMNGSNMSISLFGTFSFALTVVSCHAITGAHVAPSTSISCRSLPFSPENGLYRTCEPLMPRLKGSCSCAIESDLVLFPAETFFHKKPEAGIDYLGIIDSALPLGNLVQRLFDAEGGTVGPM
ncbi:MAG: hypothetical protein A4E65_02412 [Syntrophorhabdus sp. PtaU1.Bin153]|nr:MAG: hypothetical protein A4E65_02412 [Syntrophorhabdus sp. PtaU1.Bin153]